MCIRTIAGGCGSEARKVLKCGHKFCCNPDRKTENDVQECRAKSLAKNPKMKNCYYHREGAGCKECGGKTVKVGASMHCFACGSSE